MSMVDVNALCYEYRPRLVGHAVNLGMEPADADDQVQNALLKVIEKGDASRGSPVAFSFTVLANLCRDEHRKRARHPTTTLDDWHPDPVDSPEELIFRIEFGALVKKSLEELKSEDRAILRMKYGDDKMSIVQIAERLNCSPSSVNRRISNILRALEEKLSNFN